MAYSDNELINIVRQRAAKDRNFATSIESACKRKDEESLWELIYKALDDFCRGWELVHKLSQIASQVMAWFGY